ncbi:MAG: aminotransferase class V-fold PLP-dependent enzyme [Microbacteriaceae bacterium]|nr:aminotransferase class V-fold PLP-dependent enzyme [Microbacteriaceae bacterium]
MTQIPSSAELDAADPLARFRERFAPSAGLVAYLDGNSLGRPLAASLENLERVAREEWGGRLIRGWDEVWLDEPVRLGDRLAEVALGAAAGQTVIGDSTTVLLYKQIRAALALRPGRDEIVVHRDDFPTDRYVLEGIAAETGATLRWIDPGDVTPDAVAALAGPRTALVVLSAIAYRSGALADVVAITDLVHGAGALMLWDLCHAVGAIPLELDAWGVDLAVGCGYKYLNGGPGAPAFAYVRAGLLEEYRQPIQGWIGSATPFEMGQGYAPGPGIRRVLSGTPPILGMAALGPAIEMLAEAGMDAVRTKSMALTEHALSLADELLPTAVLASPRDPARRGGHVTLDHDGFEVIMPRLWERGVIPDFRRPNGIRLGLSPLSTGFAEVEAGVRAIAEELAAAGA